MSVHAAAGCKRKNHQHVHTYIHSTSSHVVELIMILMISPVLHRMVLLLHRVCFPFLNSLSRRGFSDYFISTHFSLLANVQRDYTTVWCIDI
jgi:hypothetical protein